MNLGLGNDAEPVDLSSFTEYTEENRQNMQRLPSSQGEASGSMDFEAERIKALEYIVRHYTGLERYDRQALEKTIAGISLKLESLPESGEGEGEDEGEGGESRSANTAPTMEVNTGEANDEMNNFRCEMSSTDTEVNETGGNSHLISQEAAVLEAVSLFPPAPSALVLLRVFLEFTQTNYFYFDEESLRQRLDRVYSCSSMIKQEDAPWVSVVLMVFALGVQFTSHDQSPPRDSSRELTRDAHDICQGMDDSTTSKFYQVAMKLIPDILVVESIESVQAFLLFGLYTLPTDPAGLSYTYFGIAIKLATQLNIHLKTTSIACARDLEVRKRVWWTAYALERFLHGRPASISRFDANADLPVDMEELQPKERINTFQNTMAMLRINIFMEDARDRTMALINSDKAIQRNDFQNIVHLKDSISSYWYSLSERTFCRDLTPGKPLFRPNIHLALNYHLLHVSMGRCLITKNFNIGVSCTRDTAWLKVRASLVDDCIDSAIAIIDLCWILHDEKYLSKFSHLELSSCYAAVMALVASYAYDKNHTLRDVYEKGVKILQDVSTEFSSIGFRKHVAESLGIAFKRLDNGRKRSAEGLDENGYKQFRNWVALQEMAPQEGPATEA
ncbi:hypothetical protein FPSE_05825 [Fusarium pseudograminearum CS3096]|uniref:Xylanolytic transcriptional activator regulatory domain-containing protein n=1 Tax=Fusarium pseudograminearum (strain CS3096) TaxID=1028729 RepID=K3VHP4_FUSPC|nr:hypothetical protein FPSE_05825 [Fusarium pseudograminearum CS3096]EKJ73982.1 hypothetical protein FPSE_05825 [Fusarium pseudograminearum CS3096]